MGNRSRYGSEVSGSGFSATRNARDVTSLNVRARPAQRVSPVLSGKRAVLRLRAAPSARIFRGLERKRNLHVKTT